MSETKRIGRPPKAAGQRKRHNQTFRINDANKERLERAAELQQRSVSEEIEARIDQSFANESVLGLLYGDGVAADLWRVSAKVQFAAARYCRVEKFSEERTREIIKAALYRVLTVYCWHGGDLPQSSHVSVHGRPVPKAQWDPEHIGVEIADSEMMYHGDRMLDAQGEGIIEPLWGPK